MASIITYVFRSEAPYSSSELAAVKEELDAIAIESDDDFIEGSSSIELEDSEAVDAKQTKDDEKVDAAVQDILKNSAFNVSVSLRDSEHNILAKTNLMGDSE